MAVEDLVSEELLLTLESDIDSEYTSCLRLESPEEIRGFLYNTKQVVKRIIDNIRKFFADLTQKISVFLTESTISSKIRKIEKMEEVNPRFRNYKVMAIDTAKYASLYHQLVSELNDMNKKPITNDYSETLDNIYNKFVMTVSGMPAAKVTMPKVVTMNRTVLETIRVVGSRNYPEPRNEIIARYYARAATECGKLCSASVKQLTDAINSNKMKRFMDDLVRFLR